MNYQPNSNKICKIENLISQTLIQHLEEYHATPEPIKCSHKCHGKTWAKAFGNLGWNFCPKCGQPLAEKEDSK